jgi:hypothetical protein
MIHTTTYTATIDSGEIGIFSDRPAGVSGPVIFEPRPADLVNADAWLAAQSFERTGDWTMKSCYDGLRLYAPVIRK